jgi:hypothetical protein
MLAPGTRSGTAKLGELPAASPEDKIEVWERVADDGTAFLDLVEYSWGSGLGWYVRKRVSLEPSQVEALAGLLGVQRAAPTPSRPTRPLPPVERDGNTLRIHFDAP